MPNNGTPPGKHIRVTGSVKAVASARVNATKTDRKPLRQPPWKRVMEAANWARMIEWLLEKVQELLDVLMGMFRLAPK